MKNLKTSVPLPDANKVAINAPNTLNINHNPGFSSLDRFNLKKSIVKLEKAFKFMLLPTILLHYIH